MTYVTQVYEISKPTAPEDDLGFYKSYADEADDAILEPMCGTGRFLLPLAKGGYKIDGSDASEHMLDVIKRQERRFRLSAPSGYEQSKTSFLDVL